MCAKKTFGDKAVFEEKYNLYGDMLYKLGIIYFGAGNDNQKCQEAIDEAFLWLLTRKKGFKNSEKEKLELIRHMVLICNSKSKKRAISAPKIEDETSENAFCSESMDMLEAAYGLPSKYKPVLHLALYEDLDMRHISKILSIPRPIVKNLLAKGMELMEMVLERKLDGEYYRSILDKIHPSPEAKEALYQYVVSHHSVKKYITPRQKRAAILLSIAMASAVFIFTFYNSQMAYSVKTKYTLLKGGIASTTIENLVSYSGSGVLFTKDSDKTASCQAYTIKNKKLKSLDTRLVSGSINYLGESYPISFYCCEKDNSLAIWRNTSADNCTVAPIKNNTKNVLAYIYCNKGKNSYFYPLIVNINTLETTDFLAGLNLSQLDGFYAAYFNENLTEATVFTSEGELYYCDTSSLSLVKIATYKNSYPSSIQFNEDGTILYGIKDLMAPTTNTSVSYYEYSIASGTVRDCLQINPSNDCYILFAGNNTAVVAKGNNECSIVDVKSKESTSVHDIQGEDLAYLYVRESPDGTHLMLQFLSTISNLDKIASKIYTYDAGSKEITALNLPELEGTAFTNAFWYDNKHIAVEKHAAKYYNFDANSTNSNKTVITDRINSEISKTSLWLFDITKLK